MRALKMRNAGQPSEVDNNQFRAIINPDPLTTAQEVAIELNINHSTVIQHLKQIGKTKKLDRWVPFELNENQKHCHSEVTCSLFLCNNNKSFLGRIVICNENWILYDNQQ